MNQQEAFYEHMKRKHGVSDLYQYLRSTSYEADWADWQAAYSAGAEQMRERAAKLVGTMDYSRSVSDAITYAAEAIRNLPVVESSRAPEGTKP